jgi:hypothetical protein
MNSRQPRVYSWPPMSQAKGASLVKALGETERCKERAHTPQMKTEDNCSSHPVAQLVPFAEIGEQGGADINQVRKLFIWAWSPRRRKAHTLFATTLTLSSFVVPY